MASYLNFYWKKIAVGILGTLFAFVLVWIMAAMPAKRTLGQTPDLEVVALSGELLYAVKAEAPTDSLEKAIANLSVLKLAHELPNDTARKVFWINLYNAYYQILAKRNDISRPGIFTEKLITFSDVVFSLDDIEHGILRKYRWKLSMGYLPQFWPDNQIKKLAVDKVDYRIHFALNCGAASCPPIAFYDYDKLDAQLDLATKSFLDTDLEIDTVNMVVTVSKIMQWFKGDFGGEAGMRDMLTKFLGKPMEGYNIRYKDYDWTTQLGNFAE